MYHLETLLSILALLTVVNVALLTINLKILTENYTHHLLRKDKP
jgi:hypothetical protein